jgi:hypothetical protein
MAPALRMTRFFKVSKYFFFIVLSWPVGGKMKKKMNMIFGLHCSKNLLLVVMASYSMVRA